MEKAMFEGKVVKTIDLTPRWVDIVHYLAHAYVGGSIIAGEELKRLASFADNEIEAKKKAALIICDRCKQEIQVNGTAWGNCPDCGDNICEKCADGFDEDGICQKCNAKKGSRMADPAPDNAKDNEYQIYVKCARDLGWEIKTYDEWLNT